MKKLLFAGLILALLSFAFTFKTERTITGTIKDITNTPIPFATVTAKDTRNSVAASANGSFNIKIADNVKALEVSAVGFQTQEIKLTSATKYSIVLKANANVLNEFIIPANRVQQKTKSNGYELQGSVAGISVQDYNKASYASPQIAKDEEDKTDEVTTISLKILF